jgi:hypothetical protein
MQNRYTPILRWKQGERTALEHLSAAGRTNVTPHIVLTQAQFGGPKKSKTPTKAPKKMPLSASEYVVKQIADAWGQAAFYLDASDLPGDPTKHSLDDILVKSSATGLHLIPSTRLQAPAIYSAAVARTVELNARGVALRLSLAQMTSAPDWIGLWPFPPQETDLIVDLANSATNVFALGQSVQSAFQALHKGNAWRSVTVAGGNIPANLTGYLVGCTMLPRAEMQLWKFLISKELSYQLHYGDYTTIGPDATTEGIEGPVPINAKYTLQPNFAVFHGVKTKGPGAKPRDQQYRNYASQIIKLPNRGALSHCWGDNVINAIAGSHTVSPGSPASWVSYSVNRHIELTRSQLP